MKNTIKSDRELAIEYWDKIPVLEKRILIGKYRLVDYHENCYGRYSINKTVDSLTGREIQKIWRAETKTEYNDIPRDEVRPKDFWEGFDYACALLDEMYALTHPHKFNIADCIKAKVNRLAKSKIRKNK